MKKLLCITLACFICNSTVEALLPPLWQGVSELNAILNEENLANHLSSGDIILAIHKTHYGYLIVTSRGFLEAHVVYEVSDGMPGPAKFHIENTFSSLSAKKKDKSDGSSSQSKVHHSATA